MANFTLLIVTLSLTRFRRSHFGPRNQLVPLLKFMNIFICRWHHLSIYDISYMWYAGVACFIVLVVGGVASIAFSIGKTHR